MANPPCVLILNIRKKCLNYYFELGFIRVIIAGGSMKKVVEMKLLW